jgi:Zn-dependent M16 (insulinase) family peptidase
VLEAAELIAMQDEEQDPECLPTLTPADIARRGTYADIENTTVWSARPSLNCAGAVCLCRGRAHSSGVPTQWCDQPTNGVIYIKVHLDSAALPAELRPFLPVCSSNHSIIC